MTRERRRYGDRRHPAEFPKRFAVEIIRPHLFSSRRDDFSPRSVFPNVRRRPVCSLFTLDPPDLIAGLLVQGDHERLGIVVIYYIDSILVEHRRCGGSPAVTSHEGSPLLRPDQFAIHIKTEQPNVAEIRIDALAISNRSLRSIAVLEMSRAFWCAFLDLLLPLDLSGFEVDAVDHPLMSVSRGLSLTTKVESLLRLFAFDRAHD